MHWQYQGRAEAIGPPAGPEQWQPASVQPLASLNRAALLAVTGLVFLPPPVTVDQWQSAPPQPDRTQRRAQVPTGAVAPLLPPTAVVAPTWFGQGTQPQPSRAFRLTRTPEVAGPVYVPPVVTTVALDWLQALSQPTRALRVTVPAGLTRPLLPPSVPFDWIVQGAQPVRLRFTAAASQVVCPLPDLIPVAPTTFGHVLVITTTAGRADGTTFGGGKG